MAISVLTDTTERSPTFSLAGFNNQQDEFINPSWCYLLFENSVNSKEAWNKLLFREPRALEWEEVVEQAGPQRLYGFDFSKNVLKWRGPSNAPQFRISLEESQLSLELGLRNLKVDLSTTDLLGAHLILKMVLNMHSTLLMGLMGRFESNIMTFVRPSNNKLIDRTVRYAQHLLSQNGVEVGYESLVNDCFNFMDESNESGPVVIRIVKKYS